MWFTSKRKRLYSSIPDTGPAERRRGRTEAAGRGPTFTSHTGFRTHARVDSSLNDSYGRPVPAQESLEDALHALPQERRANRRYALTLPLRYRFKGSPRRRNGEGLLTNLSSGGVLFRANGSHRPEPAGQALELTIPWPGAPAGTAGFELYVEGETVWSLRDLVAVKILRAEFRTA